MVIDKTKHDDDDDTCAKLNKVWMLKNSKRQKKNFRTSRPLVHKLQPRTFIVLLISDRNQRFTLQIIIQSVFTR